MSRARVIQIIVTTDQRGDGKSDSPYRTITEFWDLDGKFLAEYDPYPSDDKTRRQPERNLDLEMLLS